MRLNQDQPIACPRFDLYYFYTSALPAWHIKVKTNEFPFSLTLEVVHGESSSCTTWLLLADPVCLLSFGATWTFNRQCFFPRIKLSASPRLFQFNRIPRSTFSANGIKWVQGGYKLLIPFPQNSQIGQKQLKLTFTSGLRLSPPPSPIFNVIKHFSFGKHCGERKLKNNYLLHRKAIQH